MRDEDSLDGLGVETCRRHALQQETGLRAIDWEAASAGVDEHQTIIHPDGHGREGNRDVGIGQCRGTERRLGLLDVGVLDLALPVRYFDDAVAQGRYLDVPDLALEEAPIRGLLRLSRANEGDGFGKPERCAAPAALSTRSRREISNMGSVLPI